MSQQTELTCVSCESTFDPAPTGGFCPECDTPHPDFEHDDPAGDDEEIEAGTTDRPAESEADQDADSAATLESGPSYCPECGTSLADATGGGAGGSDGWYCPDCGRAVTDESYCPDCGTDLGAARGDGTDDESVPLDEAETEIPGEAGGTTGGHTGGGTASGPSSGTDGAPGSVTLVVNGEPYTFRDGETFGREEDEWLEDLVKAAGGSDALSYISGEHIEFSIEADGVYVTDISRNGTMLNGRDLDGGRAQVEDGDYLTLAGRAEVEVAF